MGRSGDPEVVGSFLILLFALLVGPLAVLYGVDSRPLARGRGERWWPGARS